MTNIQNPPVGLVERLVSERAANSLNARDATAFVVGSRNSSLTSLAGSLRRKGMEEQHIGLALLALNSTLPEPLHKDEVLRIARSVSNYDPSLDLAELTLAKRFATIGASHLRYSPQLGWMAYDGKVWKRDTQRVHVQESAKDFLEELKAQAESVELDRGEKAELLKAVRRQLRQSTAANIIQLAKSNPAILDETEWSDAAQLLNFMNGTLDLSTMEFRKHRASDRLSRLLPYDYDPAASCPHFDAVLSFALGSVEADFVMELFGYALQGTGGLQRLLILIGRGRNGKTTLVEAIANAMGGYAVSANPASFVKSANKSSINNDIAALRGARLVVTSELNTGQTLDAALIKKMTGDETIVARFLYGENFEFAFRGLLLLVTNFAPVFDGSDMAMGRRLLSVVFGNTVPEEDVDLELPNKLRLEAPGIMNRLLQGLIRFRQKGLVVPSSVQADTANLVRDGNQVQQFIDECCQVEVGAHTPSGLTYNAYRSWSIMEGLAAMSAPAFKAAMIRTTGMEPKRSRSGNLWPDIKLKV